MKNDLVVLMQMAIQLLDKGEANTANGVLKRGLTRYFSK